MHLNGYSGAPTQIVEDKSLCFVLSRVLLYTDRLSARSPDSKIVSTGFYLSLDGHG
jgi:hypothetical protein